MGSDFLSMEMKPKVPTTITKLKLELGKCLWLWDDGASLRKTIPLKSGHQKKIDSQRHQVPPFLILKIIL